MVTLLTFFTWFAVKKTPKRCTADIQRKPQFLRKRKFCGDNSSYRPLLGAGFHRPGFRRGSELSARDPRGSRAGRGQRSFPHQLLGVSANGTGQNPASRQLVRWALPFFKWECPCGRGVQELARRRDGWGRGRETDEKEKKSIKRAKITKKTKKALVLRRAQ